MLMENHMGPTIIIIIIVRSSISYNVFTQHVLFRIRQIESIWSTDTCNSFADETCGSFPSFFHFLNTYFLIMIIASIAFSS